MRTLTPRKAWTCCSDPMSYVFQRSSVQMMHCSGLVGIRGSAKLANCVAILFSSLGNWSGLLMDADFYLPALRPVPLTRLAFPLGFFLLTGCRIINLHAGAVAQSSENFVASRDYLVPLLQPVGYFDVG